MLCRSASQLQACAFIRIRDLLRHDSQLSRMIVRARFARVECDDKILSKDYEHCPSGPEITLPIIEFIGTLAYHALQKIV